ncbi:uncharacterized protein PSANT_05131 [Moesziomyces antarcticus]|uniref:Uncharacterized protein n=1 Tax=Pseudozyma antarctica TaxID=84753 RepID=A0A5C3FSP0_PSEA2|nr:uncharacterized protein PSANT_05131 [Moesziomyces antarcticus]
MDAEQQEPLVFHESSIPVDGAAKKRSGGGGLHCCAVTAVVLLALLGGAVVLGIGYLARQIINDTMYPTRTHALASHHAQRFNASQVHPLIDARSTFHMHATVWQDVTDLLARGGSLPERDTPWELVETVLPKRSGLLALDNYTRTEAIVYEGQIGGDLTLADEVHTSISLRVPIAPLYTANLGPSSLRATFSLSVPEHEASELGAFRNVSYIFGSGLPMLPRRKDSTLRPAESDLNTALADVGVSAPLLELVPSPWFRANANGDPMASTINMDRASAMFSAHPAQLRFLNPVISADTQPEGMPELLGYRGNIVVPHVRTRSRIGIVRSTDVFENATYQAQHFAAQVDAAHACSTRVGGVCERAYRKHPFETMLTFEPEEDKEVHYYAPVLTQMHLLGSAHSKRRIPKHLPLPGEPLAQALRSNASAQCEIPPVSLDDKREYMHFDWSIYVSAHQVARASLAESASTTFYRAKPAPLRQGEEGDKEIVANTIADMGMATSMDRFMTGDRYHASDRPGRLVASSLATLVWNDIADPIQAQWAHIALHIGGFFLWLLRPLYAEAEFSLVELFFQLLGLVYLVYQVSTILQLERPPKFSAAKWWKRNPLAFRRRRLTRHERSSIAIARSINKTPFYIIFGLIVVFQITTDDRVLHWASSDECFIDDARGTQQAGTSSTLQAAFIGFAAIGASLKHSVELAQAWFNYRNKTYAGTFKITAVTQPVVAATLFATLYAERLSKHTSNSYPLGPHAILEVAVPAILAAQAVVYPGIKQVKDKDEDNE